MERSDKNPYYISSSLEVLCELQLALENGNVIGIWSTSLGEGMFLCGVESIRENARENDITIILKEHDLRGVRLTVHVLSLKEIEKLYPFKTIYNDPLHQKLRDLKDRNISYQFVKR